MKNFIEIEREPRIKNFIQLYDPNVIHKEKRKILFKGSWRESSKETGSNSASEKRRDRRDTLKIQKRRIEGKEKSLKITI